MHATDLLALIDELGFGKSELARLVGVTLRAVNLWCSGDRGIPGPVVAYLRLLKSLPGALRAQELARLNIGDTTMSDGMYVVDYVGREGDGIAVLVFMDGFVFGHDGQVRYDGTYAPCPNRPGFIDLKVRLNVPSHATLVTGMPPQPAPYWFDIEATIPARGEARLPVETPYSPVVCNVRYLRELPQHFTA